MDEAVLNYEVLTILCTPRRRSFSGAERGSRSSQRLLNIYCERMRATEHAPRDPCHILERRHGLSEIGERGAGVEVDRLRVITPHPEHGFITLSEGASRQRQRFSQQ